MEWVYTSLFQYYFSDWLAAIFLCVYLYLIGEKKRCGFIFAMLSSCCWIIYSVLTASLANVLVNLVCIYMFVKNYLKWSKSE